MNMNPTRNMCVAHTKFIIIKSCSNYQPVDETAPQPYRAWTAARFARSTWLSFHPDTFQIWHEFETGNACNEWTPTARRIRCRAPEIRGKRLDIRNRVAKCEIVQKVVKTQNSLQNSHRPPPWASQSGRSSCLSSPRRPRWTAWRSASRRSQQFRTSTTRAIWIDPFPCCTFRIDIGPCPDRWVSCCIRRWRMPAKNGVKSKLGNGFLPCTTQCRRTPSSRSQAHWNSPACRRYRRYTSRSRRWRAQDLLEKMRTIKKIEIYFAKSI